MKQCEGWRRLFLSKEAGDDRQGPSGQDMVGMTPLKILISIYKLMHCRDNVYYYASPSICFIEK